MNKYSVIGSNVLVVVPEIKSKTKGGIIKSSDMLASEKNGIDSFRKVISIGAAVTEIKVGDLIHFSGGYVMEDDIDGKIYQVVNEMHILMVKHEG